MRKKLSKSNILIAQKGLSLVVVFATLLTAFVAIAPWTYGWFSKNDTVTVSGIHTQAYHSKFDVSYAVKQSDGSYQATDPSALFDTIKAPGQSVEVQVTITNKSINKYTVNLTGFGLEAPSTAQDVPKLDDEGKIRYLSTEITTQLISVSVTDGDSVTNYGVIPEKEGSTDSAPVPLRTGSSTEPGAAERIDYIDAIDQTKISVPVGGSVTFTIRLTFVNATYNQNIYKNFAETGGKCERTFFFTFEDDMSSSS